MAAELPYLLGVKQRVTTVDGTALAEEFSCRLAELVGELLVATRAA